MDVIRELPPTVLGGLAVLVVMQLSLQATALVQLYRTDVSEISLGGRRWLWAVIIVGGEIFGPLVWFFMGRRDAPDVLGTQPTVTSGHVERDVERLYPKS